MGKAKTYNKNCKHCKNDFIGVISRVYCSRNCFIKDTVTKNINSLGELFCAKCNQYKDPSLFHKSGGSKNEARGGKSYTCGNCHYAANKIRLKSFGENLERCIKKLAVGLNNKVRLKRFGKSNIDSNYLISLYKEQKGLCALSGIEMSYYVGQQGRLNNNISIDRIDNNIGYIEGNIQLVCFIVNIMKSNMDKEKLMYYCKSIIKNQEVVIL